MTRRMWIARSGFVGVLAVVAAACGDGGSGSDGGADTDTAVAADTAVVDDTSAVEDAADTANVGGDDTLEADTTPVVECPTPTGARPAARAEHAGIYDPDGQRVVLFGGSFGVPQNCSAIVAHTYESDTWIYDIPCNQWHKATGTQPVGRVRHAAAYDSQRHRMIVWGGRERKGSSGAYTLHPEMLAFDLESETWEQLTISGSAAPRARFNHVMVYDPDGDRVIVMGGNTSADPLVYSEAKDVWAFSFATGAWTDLTPTSGFQPDARFWHAGLWDPTRKWLVIYGGADNGSAFDPQAKYFDDVWAFDTTASPPQWYQLDSSQTVPDGRFWSGMVYDDAHDRYVMFGGHDDAALGNRNDTWAFGPTTGQWQRLSAGDTFNKPPAAFCQFPPDFTVVDMDAPERRHAGVFVAGPGRAFLTGGKTDCGNVDDLFSYDFADEAWEERVTATVGESCIRKGGLSCNDLCF